MHSTTARLSEQAVIEAFHTLATTALEQAQTEGLLDPSALQGDNADVTLLGPALILFFAALASRADEPSVTIPTNPPKTLNVDTCPPAFEGFFHSWAQIVPLIQRLDNPQRFDLVRLLSNLPPLHPPVRPDVARIAEMLQAVAMEISQRRSFMERYSFDLQQALDAHSRTAHTPQRTATFTAPPAYSSNGPQRVGPPPGPPPHRSAGGQYGAGAVDMSMILIRETFYAALADVFSNSPSLGPLLKRDPPRAYYAAVAMAVLSVARSEGPSGKESIRVVNLGDPSQPIALEPRDVPEPMQPIVKELILVGDIAAGYEEADTMSLAEKLGAGDDVPSTYLSRLDRLERELEHGLGWDRGRTDARLSQLEPSVQDGVRALAFRINALALRITSLQTFQERAAQTFEVLAALAVAS